LTNGESAFVEDNRIAAGQNGERAEHLQLSRSDGGTLFGARDSIYNSGRQPGFKSRGVQFLAGKTGTGIEQGQARMCRLQAGGESLAAGVQRPLQRVVRFVQTLPAALNAELNGRPGAVCAVAREALLDLPQGAFDGPAHDTLVPGEFVENAPQIGRDDFRGCRGRGRAEVGREIGDGKVRLMSDGGDDGHMAGEDRSRHDLLIKAPEVFKASAAPGDDDDVGPTAVAEVQDAFADLLGAAGALDERGVKLYLEAGATAFEDVEHVLYDGAGGRGDDANAAGEFREFAFMPGVEEPFFLQTLFQFLEGLLECAGAERFQVLDVQLIRAALLIDVDGASRLHHQAILKRKPDQAQAVAEQRASEYGVFFLEVEVGMAAGGGLEARNLAGHTHVREAFAHHAPQLAGELLDAQNLVRLTEQFHSNDNSGETGMKTPARQVPLLDLQAQHRAIREEVLAELIPLIDSQRFIMGPAVGEFECKIAGYTKTRFAIGCASGSDALMLAFMALELGPGDKVITTPYSFFATAGSLARLGVEPVFVDIDPVTFNLDPNQVEDAFQRHANVWAVQPVHLFGGCSDMDPLLEIAPRYGAVVIEDAAQAIGAEYKGRRAGGIGAMGCFSFYPGKNLGAYGDAGMVTTNDANLADAIYKLRIHGGREKYYHELVGVNSRIDTLQAAVLKVKFRHLDMWTECRQHNAHLYRKLFAAEQLPIQVPTVAPYQTRHVFNQFTILAPRRDELREFLTRHGVGTEIYYPVPLHLQECFRELGYEEGDCPVSERVSREALSLPVYPELDEEDLRYVVETISRFYGSSK
jgi:dTDP-4-amino-4,6-dideoxygalactose transaminase